MIGTATCRAASGLMSWLSPPQAMLEKSGCSRASWGYVLWKMQQLLWITSDWNHHATSQRIAGSTSRTGPPSGPPCSPALFLTRPFKPLIGTDFESWKSHIEAYCLIPRGDPSLLDNILMFTRLLLTSGLSSTHNVRVVWLSFPIHNLGSNMP